MRNTHVYEDSIEVAVIIFG